MSVVFDPEEFGKWLQEKFENSKFKSWQELANAVDTTRSTLSRLAGAKPQSINGRPSQPNPDLIIKLSKVFGADVDEALIIGGHAPLDREFMNRGQFGGLKDLSPERQAIARRQIKAIIDSLAEEDEHDFDYIDETKPHR